MDREARKQEDERSYREAGYPAGPVSMGGPDTERLLLPRSARDLDAAPPISREDVEAHRGQWVLLHAGRVIDSCAGSCDSLLEHHLAMTDSALYLVPGTDRRFH